MKKDMETLKNCLEILKDKKVLVACSTGVDSMVLLDLCLKYLNKSNVGVIHVNHKKRAQSEIEEQYIKDFCKEKGLKLFVKELKLYQGNSFQSWARKERYDFFKEICLKEQYDYVLLAHHADDNLETILMRLLKSSSLKGYAGIEQFSTYQGMNIFRPLIEFSKEEIYEYAKENNLKYFEDSSNTEDDYERNRIRHFVVPLLKEENPNIYQAIKNYSDTLLSANELVEKEMSYFLEKVKVINKKNYIIKTFKYVDFDELSNFIKEQVLFRLTKSIGLSKKMIMELIKQLKNDKVINKINNNLLVIKEYLEVSIVIGKIIEPSFNLLVTKPGKYLLENGKTIEVSQDDLIQDTNKLCYNTSRIKVNSFPIVLRTRLDGDKISLKSYSVKLSDLLTNKKVKYLNRLNTIVVTDKNEIIKLLIDDQYKEDK